MFYKKIRKAKQKTKVLDYIDKDIKLVMNWNMIKNGASVNEVFKMNPSGLDSFLTEPKKDQSQELQGLQGPQGQDGVTAYAKFI